MSNICSAFETKVAQFVMNRPIRQRRRSRFSNVRSGIVNRYATPSVRQQIFSYFPNFSLHIDKIETQIVTKGNLLILLVPIPNIFLKMF